MADVPVLESCVMTKPSMVTLLYLVWARFSATNPNIWHRAVPP